MAYRPANHIGKLGVNVPTNGGADERCVVKWHQQVLGMPTVTIFTRITFIQSSPPVKGDF
ncbi:predicted protein [Histoplasma mississippiense (nom. inval.)]|uniref:predicted protein n=1 Tax=Ajellomyces capsulatus (strain NAm1 / WU24) TaxID=2059318 RepID=UPI000157C7DA|nr:predicted protein [Histoplasma mississippiense (nom. inval.)]EDN09361.1 predicted protein [Histoplasma mississippiense (nom. inval.)]